MESFSRLEFSVKNRVRDFQDFVFRLLKLFLSPLGRDFLVARQVIEAQERGVFLEFLPRCYRVDRKLQTLVRFLGVFLQRLST
jgi:hypothetical protein